jgi:hypothetical protein
MPAESMRIPTNGGTTRRVRRLAGRLRLAVITPRKRRILLMRK